MIRPRRPLGSPLHRGGMYTKWDKPSPAFVALTRLCVIIVFFLACFAGVFFFRSSLPLAVIDQQQPPPPPPLTKQEQLEQLMREEELAVGLQPESLLVPQSEEEADDIKHLDNDEQEQDDYTNTVSPLSKEAEDDERLTPNEEEELEQSHPADPENIPILPEVNKGVFGDYDMLGGTFDSSTGVVSLQAQIRLPEVPIIQHFDSTQNYWPLHSILRHRGWAYATTALPSKVNMWISRGQVPPRMKEGTQMLNSMGVSGCIGGSKSLQLECRRRLATLHGCEYESLKIQPSQYNMLKPEDCSRLASQPETTELKPYLTKPTYTFHGSGIKIHQDTPANVLAKKYCGMPVIIMDYIAKPATMFGGYKFDFRTYLLVASLKPQLVFYHDGFVRKSDKKFDLLARDLNVHITNKVSQSKEEHFFNFQVLQEQLHQELGLPKDYITNVVVPKAKRVTRFLFQTTLVQQKSPRHVAGRFHLFGIDWMLDSKGELHLLEGNGYPLVTQYPPELGLTPRIWEEMTDLILGLQTNPEEFLSKQPQNKLTVATKFSYGGWHLVFNELEELGDKARGNAYNVCRAFA